MNEEHSKEGEELGVERESVSHDHSQPKRNKPGMVIMAVVLIAIIALAAFFLQRNGESAVARVNGENITRSEYQSMVRSVEGEWEREQAFLVEQGQDPISVNNPEAQAIIEEEAINRLINELVVLSAAREAGFEATDAEVDEMMDAYRDQYESRGEFMAGLRGAGLTEAGLRKLVKSELSAQAYFNAVVPAESLTVSDQEVERFFEENRSFFDESMTLEEFSEEIGRPNLEAQKMQEVVMSLLAELRSEADIEILIDINTPQLQGEVAPEVTDDDQEEGLEGDQDTEISE